MNTVIVVAAGSGSRMKHFENKVFLKLGTRSVLQESVYNASMMEELEEIIVVAAPGEEGRVRLELEGLALTCPYQVVTGGKTRQESVLEGLKVIRYPQEEQHVVLVHDGARPLAKPELFNRCARKAQEVGGAIVGTPCKDTIKLATNGEGDLQIQETLPRERLWAAQTPQAFVAGKLLAAHMADFERAVTDDASLLEAWDLPVAIVEGTYENIKITTPSDMVFAKQFLGIKEVPMRVGFGYDVHVLKEGRPCILGGVHIPSAVGPDGHSDADVIVHALMDALLGAAGLKDIGHYFPPTDDAYLGASSMKLLEEVVTLLREEGYVPNNVDMMAISEVPKLAPHIDAMKENISAVLGITTASISIKATTNEGLGAIGRKEGIAAQAVVSIVARED